MKKIDKKIIILSSLILLKDGKITKEFCAEVIDFILNNTTDDNHKILKILERYDSRF